MQDGPIPHLRAALTREAARAKLFPSLEVRPVRIGRYIVGERVGAGGMGEVFAATDPELHRKLAIKLVHSAVEDPRSQANVRLLREARALASLDHPSIVPVHDVGTHDGRIWIAMEYIDGQTMRQWLEAPRPIDEVFDVLIRAGRGLAAAHAAGILHRDFKPDNVMISPAGVDRPSRVRVTDFGLAASVGTADATPSRAAVTPESIASDRVTHTNTVLGTTGYVAPERLGQGPVDARSDQYAFCVTAHEALYGVKPDAAAAANGHHRDRAARAPERSVPARIRAIIARGLAPDPGQRFASMDALLDELTRDPTAARLRVLRRAGAIGIVGALLVLAFVRYDRARRIAACEGVGATIEDVWNDERRAAVRAGMVATGAGHAATMVDKLMPWVDAQANAWRRARTDTCLDDDVHGSWDADLVDRSEWCLDDRLFELQALVQALEQANTESVTHSVTAASTLRRIEPCRDAQLLLRSPPPPTEQRDEVQAVRVELSRAAVLQATGEYAQGLEVANACLQQAEALGWPVLIAAAQVRVGRLLEASGAYADAEAMLEAAYFSAATVGAHEEALAATHALVVTVGYRRNRPEDAARWLRHADVTRAAVPDTEGLDEADGLHTLAVVKQASGADTEAAELHERALAIRQRALGDHHPLVGASLLGLANTHDAAGEYLKAVDLYTRTLAIQEESLGRDHPLVALTLNNLAIVRAKMGSYGEAEALFERSLASRRAALGSDHVDVAASLTNLANVRYFMGAYAEAAELHEQALAIAEKVLDADHPTVVASLNNLGSVKHAMGAYAEATAFYERALNSRERTLGPDHPEVASVLGNLGSVYDEIGDHGRAAALYERALRVFEKALGPDHPDTALALTNLALAREATGAYAQAVALHERALKIREKALGPDHPQVADVVSNLAGVLAAMGESARAGELYERALVIFETAMGSEHPRVAYPLVGLARLALARRRHADAVPLAERAVAIREAGNEPATDLAEARFVLARAVVRSPGQRARAVALAEQASDAYRDAGSGHRDAFGEVQEFLRAQERARRAVAARR